MSKSKFRFQYSHPLIGTVRWDFLSKSNQGSLIVLENNWNEKYLQSIFIPQLKDKPITSSHKDKGVRYSQGRVIFHKRAIYQIQSVFEEIENQGLLNRILTFDGTYHPRVIHGTRTPSLHAFGLAIDINANWNPYHINPPPAHQKGSVRELVPIFEKFGFRWGGYFKKPDGMHFEVYEFLDELECKKRQQIHHEYNDKKAPNTVFIFIDGKPTKIGAILLPLSSIDNKENIPLDKVESYKLHFSIHHIPTNEQGEVLYPFIALRDFIQSQKGTILKVIPHEKKITYTLWNKTVTHSYVTINSKAFQILDVVLKNFPQCSYRYVIHALMNVQIHIQTQPQ